MENTRLHVLNYVIPSLNSNTFQYLFFLDKIVNKFIYVSLKSNNRLIFNLIRILTHDRFYNVELIKILKLF